MGISKRPSIRNGKGDWRPSAGARLMDKSQRGKKQVLRGGQCEGRNQGCCKEVWERRKVTASSGKGEKKINETAR